MTTAERLKEKSFGGLTDKDDVVYLSDALEILKDTYSKEEVEELLKEFVKPFERLNANGIEIIPDSKDKLRGLSHREVFSFINDLLQVRGCKIRDFLNAPQPTLK